MMASRTASRQDSGSYSTKRATPKLRREARKTSNVENADLRTVNKEIGTYRKDLLSIRAKDPREILAIHSMKEEIDPALKMFRRQYMRKDPVFVPKLDIIHEGKETHYFNSSRELPPLLPQEPESSSSGSGSRRPPQSGSERGINDVSRYNSQRATPRAGSPFIFGCELADPLAEPLKPHPPRKQRKTLYSKYFTTSSSAAKNGKIKKRGKWTDPNSPKEKGKLWSLWEPRQATPGSSSSGLSTPTTQKGRKDGVIIERVPRLPEPFIPNNDDEEDHTSRLSITPTTEAKPPNLLPSLLGNRLTKREREDKPTSTSSSFFCGRGKGEYPSSSSSSFSSSSSSSSDKSKTKSKGKGKEKETESGIDSYDAIDDESSGSSGLSVSGGNNGSSGSSASSQTSAESVSTHRRRNFLRFRNFLATGKGSGK